MPTLSNSNLKLRALEPSDLQFLISVENDEQFWEVSNTQIPFSKFVLENYIKNAQQDIYEAKQFRFVIELIDTHKPIGFIDLFDFCPKNKRVGVGIIIKTKYQQKGYATSALQLLIEYGFTYLDVHQLYANISSTNTASLQLFKNQGFIETGSKKDWNYFDGKFTDELLLQRIKDY